MICHSNALILKKIEAKVQFGNTFIHSLLRSKKMITLHACFIRVLFFLVNSVLTWTRWLLKARYVFWFFFNKNTPVTGVQDSAGRVIQVLPI